MAVMSNFAWGVATSAYQIEGGVEDGKGESIWDRFAAMGRMSEDGLVACDHYHRYADDVELMAGLGVNSYRFSLAWTRILPDGDGEVNQTGLDFYRRLVDALLENGITPWITLFHWDLPQALQDRGGWPARAVVSAFTRYAEVVTEALGDRVKHWITHNEPWVSAFLGYQEGVFPPGIQDWAAALRASHHLLLSHGRAIEVIRSNVEDAHVGIALDCRPSRPASDDPADVAAREHFDGYRNRWFFDPIFGKGYPETMVEAHTVRGRFPADMIHAGDMEVIASPIDFLGINYYTSVVVGFGGEESDVPAVTPGAPALPGYTEMGWEVTPDALTAFLERVNADYAPASIVITENGASYSDAPGDDGVVHDRRRIGYLEAHIEAVTEAIDRGVPVDGYFVWSLLDNLEWTSGYSQRFGLVWVDHRTQHRLPKASYYWYRDRITRGRG